MSLYIPLPPRLILPIDTDAETDKENAHPCPLASPTSLLPPGPPPRPVPGSQAELLLHSSRFSPRVEAETDCLCLPRLRGESHARRSFVPVDFGGGSGVYLGKSGFPYVKRDGIYVYIYIYVYIHIRRAFQSVLIL